MYPRLLAILLCTVSFGVGGGFRPAAPAVAATGSSGMQNPPSPAPTDTAGAAAGEAARPTVGDTTAPAFTHADTTGRTPAAGGEVVIYGSTALADGTPLPEVRADLFVAGLEAASATTDTSGAFSIVHPLDKTADQTVVVWLTPPRGSGLVREIVVLKESAAARVAHEFGPCFTRAPLKDSTFVEVQILDQKSYAKKLEESGCMEQVVEETPTFELSYALDVGDSLTLTTSDTDRFVQQLGGSEMAEKTISRATFAVTVDSVGTDGMTLGVEYGNLTFTTDNPRARGAPDFSKLVGKKVSLALSSRGETSRFAGFDALPEIEAEAGRTLYKDSYINQLKHLLPILPEGPVAAGDTWTDEYTLRETHSEGSVATSVSVKYTLVGETVFKGFDCLEIDAESSITVKGQGTMANNPFTLSTTGTETAKIYFAGERGMMIQKDAKRTLEGTVASMGMSIPVKDEGESKVEVILP